MLQEECDRQAGLIVSEFRRKRGLRDKVSRVREAMASSSSVSVSLTSSSSSANLAAAASALSAAEQKVAARDLDHVLGEIVLLQARSEMYYKFVRKRLTVRERKAVSGFR